MYRRIHPVGQGAFYSERFKDGGSEKALVVYDCGTTKKAEKERLKDEIKMLPEGKDVDILFISHFDKDHVCGIKDLMQGRKIKRVVIPQISGFEWFYLVQDACVSKPWVGYRVNRHLFDTITGLAHSDNVGEVIEVKPINSEEYRPGNEKHPNNKRPDEGNVTHERPELEANTNLQKEEVGNIDVIPDVKSSYINSGDNVYLDNVKVWEYIPFNYTDGRDINDLKNRINSVLRDELLKAGYYSIDQVPYQEVCAIIEPYLPKINNGYKDIFGCSNASSMCVYSGCTHNTYLHSFEGHFLFAYNIYEDIFVNREGCLYTGDSILHNSNKLSFIISKLNKRNIHIGTLQIPHHGSFRNLDEGALDEMEAKGIKPNIFFVSYGTKNRYRHPSKALMKMISLRKWHDGNRLKDSSHIIGVSDNPSHYMVENFLFQVIYNQ
jgi:hypothetical protein